MKVVLISDGKYGDRAIETIKTVFPEARLIEVDFLDPGVIVDEVEFTLEQESIIEGADLLISYVRHPDVAFELCCYDKPVIVAVYFGKGFLRQVIDENPRVVMPLTMCGLTPSTGIKEIDDFSRYFGLPKYKITFQPGTRIVDDFEAIVQSPCGATERSLKFVKGKELSPKVIDSFAINIAQECRESVAYQLSKSDKSDSAGLNHVKPLLELVERQEPGVLEQDGELRNYFAEKKILLGNIEKKEKLK
ncbi:MAG: DUF166 family protein [Promethearchaeota archaeon]